MVGVVSRILIVRVNQGGSWRYLNSAIPPSSFELFSGMAWFLQHYGLVVIDCKPMLLAAMPRRIFLQRLLQLVSSSKWLLQSSKSYSEGACTCPLPLLLVQFIFHALGDDVLSKEEDDHYGF